VTSSVREELRERVESLLSAYPPGTTDRLEFLRARFEAGLAWVHFPEGLGGLGLARGHQGYVDQLLAEAGAPDNAPRKIGIGLGMAAPTILAFGTEAQKQELLRPLWTGEEVWCQLFSEPGAGSDLAALATRAVRDGDDWVVNGQKTWTTLGQHADWIFCLVRTDPTAEKKQRGISLLVFPMDSPGVTLRPIQLIDGGHEVNEVFFEDVRVPAENLVGEENRGWDYAKFLLGNERVGIARIGYTKRLLAQAKEHAAAITSGGRPLAEDPRMAARIAELENELVALELTALRVVANSADGKPHPASSVLKLRGSELQQAATELLVDIAGPLSLASFAEKGSDVPEWARVATPQYLNYRKVSIYGGSNEVQRTIIAGSILGL
jgi:hypothetical protein